MKRRTAKGGAGDLIALIDECRKQLLESHQRIATALNLIEQRVSEWHEDPDAEDDSARLARLLESYKDELVTSALAAVRQQQDDVRLGSNNHSLDLDRGNRIFRMGRRKINLTETEYQVLEILWDRAPEVVSRDTILGILYKGKAKPGARTIDVFISHIRQKLQITGNDFEFIEAVRGRGWILRGTARSARESLAA